MKIEDYGTVIYKVYSGSRSYGTNITEEMAKALALKHNGTTEGWEKYVSDVDVRGIFIPHRQYLMGPQKIDEFRDPNEEDTVYFSIGKFLRLALECNPNVVEQLFVREEDILYMNEYGRQLRALRFEFLTKNAYGRFGSYAWSQLNRMTNRTEEFKRNEKRQQLIEAVGGNWDPKNAMHLIRLLKMLLQILNEGNLETYCTFRELLLSIRNGEVSSEWVLALADDLFNQAEVALKQSKIPNTPDVEKVNQWLVKITDEVHGISSAKGMFPGASLKNLPIEYEMVDQCTLFLVSNPLIRKKSKSQAQGMVIPYKDWFTGLYEFSEFKFEKTTIEHLHKFVHQVRSCNPRHIDTIFAPDDAFLYKKELTDDFLRLMRTLPTTKRAYHTAKGYLIGNLKKMEHWEELKRKHDSLREEVLAAKKLSKEHWEKQLDEIEETKKVLSEEFKKEYDTLFEKIVLITSSEEKENWKKELFDLNQMYRHKMEQMRDKKDRVMKRYEKWREMTNKKGNMPTFPAIPDKTPNENASAMGKFSYDTILASEMYHTAKLFIELIETGTIQNSRIHEDEMYAIKHGKYKTFEEFKALIDSLIKELDQVATSSKLSTHDYENVQTQLQAMIQKYHEQM